MIKATWNRVIVKTLYKDMSSTIIIPSSVKKRLASFVGDVVSIGPDYPYDVNIGDLVTYPRGEGHKITANDGNEYLSLREKWVLAVVGDERLQNMKEYHYTNKSVNFVNTYDMKALRGRLVANLVPDGEYTTDSGIIVKQRDNVPLKATVVSVGSDSMSTKGNPIKSPAQIGETVHFMSNSPIYHKVGGDAMKKGLCTIWFYDIIAVE